MGSSPFLAAGCWFLWGWVGSFPWYCVCLCWGHYLCFGVFAVFVAPVLVAAVVVVVMCGVCVWVRVWCGGGVFGCLPRRSWLRGVPRCSLQFPATPGGVPVVVVVGGPSPLLAVGLGCDSPPLLAGAR